VASKAKGTSLQPQNSLAADEQAQYSFYRSKAENVPKGKGRDLSLL
jgi:hypothetical protein